jgi:hypothetical protein
MLWDHAFYEERFRKFLAKLYFIDWEITEYIKRNISLQSQNSLA